MECHYPPPRVIAPTIGILPWTKKEIKDLDILTRKQLTINGSFHAASDVHRLYSRRKEGGRGLTSIEDVYINRTIIIAEHLEKAQDTNSILKLVRIHEERNIMRLAKEFNEMYMEESHDSNNMKDAIKRSHEKAWKSKVTHGYYLSQIEKEDEISKVETNAWLKQRLTSHVEGFICAIQEQELNGKSTHPLPLTGSWRSRISYIHMEAILKHDLKVQAKILRDRKVVAERQRINSLFYSSPKDVYRDFRKNGSIKVKEAPSEEDVKNFWNGLWGHEGVYNEQNEWISKLRDNYCKDVKPTINHIKLEHFLKINESLKNNTSPGLDLIVGYWIKNCHSTRKKTFELFKEVSKGEKDLPEWLVKARTTLAAKNEETRNPKNYRPIACENIMMKTYTGTLALLLDEHLNENNIIAPEQAGAKKGMWGCTDQLLINRVVTNEVTKGRRNVNMIWLDHKKAYDSVPHAWIIEALKLAKVPDNIIGAIQHLIRKWQTELNIPTVNGNIRIGEILYKKGVFQGDYLSVILFILS